MMYHGANLVPENLETGEYKIGGTASVTGLNPYYVWAYSGDHFDFGATAQYPALNVDLTTKAGRLFVNGIHTGLNLIVATTDIGYAYVDTALKIDNQSEYVVAHFSVPSLACNNNLTLLHQDRPGVYIATGKATATTKSLSARPTSIDGYTPKNR
ncbi:MAG: hypothetical protein J6Y28_02945 [Acholeplasmatales bacterium]|nr:hypothetical protein [Acholeplasmatales bacterium]